jgi:branched-subunit amino acid aminotransferase/4-amino-4-deoxychorismate lyase
VDEAFLTSSTRGVHPIARLDGRALATGPQTDAARAAYDGLVAANPDP